MAGWLLGLLVGSLAVAQSTSSTPSTLYCYLFPQLESPAVTESLAQCYRARLNDVPVKIVLSSGKLLTLSSSLDVDIIKSRVLGQPTSTSPHADFLAAVAAIPEAGNVLAFGSDLAQLEDAHITDYIQHWPLTIGVAFVVHGSTPLPLNSRLGVVDVGIAYHDGSTFHRALTLKKLIALKGTASNTLQAHLLSKGVLARVLSGKSLSTIAPAGWFNSHHSYQPPVDVHPQPTPYLMTPPSSIHSDCWQPETKALPDVHDWTNKEEFIEYLVAGNRVQLLRNTTVATWSGLNRWQDLALFVQDLGLEEINQVKLASCGRFSDADMSAPLGTAYEWQSTFTSFNTTATELIATVQQAVANHSQLVYFSSITSGLHQHLKPDRMLYLTEEDWMYRRQFVWLSTKGSTTHTHFDQDYNVFIQLVGTKRFWFFPPSAHQAQRMFPRVHPLWHKSKLDLCHPDLDAYPEAASLVPTVIDVQPGDVLYIPPYVWHRVLTTSDVSLSLSTLSHDDVLRDAMTSVYKMDHKFDRLASPEGQRYAFRLYVDLLINEMVGYNSTREYIQTLLWERYQGLEHLFERDEALCDANTIPTAQHVYGDCVTDMRLVTAGFEQIPVVEVQDLLLADYIEELAAQIVGGKHVYAFFQSCFQGQEYEVTELGSPQHDLWEYAIQHHAGDDE